MTMILHQLILGSGLDHDVHHDYDVLLDLGNECTNPHFVHMDVYHDYDVLQKNSDRKILSLSMWRNGKSICTKCRFVHSLPRSSRTS